MRYYSTKNRDKTVSFREAVLKGIADDGGLFMPLELPKLSNQFFETIEQLSFPEIAQQVIEKFVEGEVPQKDLENILQDSYYFDAPLKQLDDNLSVLELFHGPTLAFKDFGARFMARVVSYFSRNSNREITILVATSGDTGSAVANGFLGQPGIRVVLLYPSGMVSEIQEKQLTTFDGNVTSLEVKGNFDDCQRLVKTAFQDADLTTKLRLSSANSINIARLLPQTFYYFRAYAQSKKPHGDLVVSVPSGNLGNLTAGLFAREMGLPVIRFIAALNANDVFLKYLRKGVFHSQAAIPTISNAMDVGNPSNFERIRALFQKNHAVIKQIIFSESFSDFRTREAIGEIYSKYGYVMDPHGAVGYLAVQNFPKQEKPASFHGMVLETAHPAKFRTAVEEVLPIKIEMPNRLKKCLVKEKKSIPIPNKFKDFKELLMYI